MRKKLFTTFIILGVLFSGAFAESIKPLEDNQIHAKPDFEPKKLVQIEETSTSISIETNVPNVEVYLNGVYQGRTDIVIADLLPGYYYLELRKSGYEVETYMIRVRRGYDLHYYFDMQKIYGTVYIKDVPANSIVRVDNSDSSTWISSSSSLRDYTVKTEPGRQNVYVKSFGYEPYTRAVDVYPYDEVSIYVDLQPAAFDLSDFKINRDSFNPEYSGHIGKCTVSFYVTASAAADIVIKAEDGTEVWTKSYDSFSTWEQSFDWNGTDNNGVKLEDGRYCVYINAAGFTDYEYVNIDRSISYPILTATKTGGGVGEVPAVFTENTGFVMLHFEGGLEGVSVPSVSGGALFNFAKHCELGITVGGYPYTRENAIQTTASFKLYSVEKLDKVTLCYGGLFRYGISTDEIPYSEYGYDTGNGIGGGVLFGLDFGKVYAGIASQITGIEQYWTNGLCLSFKPVNSLKISGWGNYTVYGCIRAGGEICFMPESSAFILNAKASATIAPSKVFPTFGIGLSYLF